MQVKIELLLLLLIFNIKSVLIRVTLLQRNRRTLYAVTMINASTKITPEEVGFC